jgi:hypothetical protein
MDFILPLIVGSFRRFGPSSGNYIGRCLSLSSNAPEAVRAFAKSVEVFANELKPKTQNLQPINQTFVSSIKQWVEGFVYRF